jgi:hypothetical protein
MRVRGQLDERWRRGPEHDVVEVLVVAADKCSQLLGPGKDDMKVGPREEFLPPLCQPGFGVVVVALGTAAMAAGVVDIVLAATVGTLVQGPPQRLRAAGEEIRYRPTVAGQQLVAKLVPGRAAVPPADVRHLWPDGLQRAQRSARRALMAACTTAKACGVRWV